MENPGSPGKTAGTVRLSKESPRRNEERSKQHYMRGVHAVDRSSSRWMAAPELASTVSARCPDAIGNS